MKNSYIIDIPDIFSSTFFNQDQLKIIPHLKGDLHKIEEYDLKFIKQIKFNSQNKNETNRNSQNSKIYTSEINHLNNNTNNYSDNEYTSAIQFRSNSIEEISIEEKVLFLPKLYELGSVKYPINNYENSPKIKFKNDLYINSKNPYIYSTTELHPFSFFYGNKTFLYEKKNKNKLILPAPRLIEINNWITIQKKKKKGIYKGIKIDNKNGLVIIDPNVTKKYSGLITNMI